MHNNTKTPTLLFYSYTHQDEPLRKQLEIHLSLMRRQGLISEWHDRKITAGTEWEKEIDVHLETTSIFLLLVSADFLASDYCYDIEMQRALDRHRQGKAHVIPIILRPCEWQYAPFAHLRVLPHNGKAVTTWESQDMAWLSIVQDLRQIVMSSRLQEITQQNRQRLLRRVRQTWIKGVLEASLHQAVLMELSLQEQPDALANPWHLEVQEINQSSRPLPAGTSIAQVYDQADGELLLLGEPGSGKTTLLLELARVLLQRAEANNNERLPVVFNLSSWTKKHLSLSDWLTKELSTKYQVPQKVAQDWIATDQIIPLLDGLDEVAALARLRCIQAINAYHHSRQGQGILPMVICCRSLEYMALSTHIDVQCAISIQPLTQEQIEGYLQRSHGQLQMLQEALQDDPELYQLACSPLILSILTLAYQGATSKDLPTRTSHETYQSQIFTAYVTRMLNRRSFPKRFSRERIQQWLAFIAAQMQLHDQTILYLEYLQPSWLEKFWIERVYEWGNAWLLNGLIGGLVSIALTTFICSSDTVSFTLLIQTFLLGTLFGLLLSQKDRVQQFITDRRKARDILGSQALNWMGIGGIIGISFGLLGRSWSFGLSFGLCSILLQGLLGKRPLIEHIVQMPLFSRMMGPHLLRMAEVYNGILAGLLIGVNYGLNNLLMSLRSPNLRGNDWFTIARDIGVQYWLSYGLAVWLLGILFRRCTWEVHLTDRFAWSLMSLWRSLTSKQHMRMTLRVTALIWLFSWLADGLTMVMDLELARDPLEWITGLLISFLMVGVTNAFIGGLSYWFLFGLFQGVSDVVIENRFRITPNQGIYHSALNGLLFGLVSTVVVGLSSGLAIGLQNFSAKAALSDGLAKGFIIGLSAGLLTMLLNGGLAYLRHYLLRLLLWYTGAIPWNVECMLDEAVQRILLRKVGGGYIFIHSLLRDHFASSDQNNSKTQQKQ